MTQKNPMQEPNNGRSRVSGAHGETSGLLDAAKETATHLASEAKGQFETRASTQKDRAAERLSNVANALRSTEEGLREEVPFVGDYANRAAEGVQELSRYIQTKTVGELIDDVENFARREPALFFGGAIALGVIAGRFLKSSPRPVMPEELSDDYGFEEPRDFSEIDRPMTTASSMSGARVGSYGHTSRRVTDTMPSTPRTGIGGSSIPRSTMGGTSSSSSNIGGSNIGSYESFTGTTASKDDEEKKP